MENYFFKFRILDTINKDHEAYKKLHNLLFIGASTTSEWIDWYHNKISKIQNWSIGTRTWGVFDKDELIGIWSVEPKIFQVNKNKIKVGRCFAVGIHPDYRRHGLFVSLSKFAISEEKKIGEFEFILGFPQVGRSVIGGHLKAGWEEILNINIISRKNEPKLLGPSRKNVSVINNFDEISNNNVDGILEKSEYKNLRWINHPDIHYLNYRYKNATIVLKPYGKICHILDISGPKDDVFYLLEFLRSLSIKHGWEEVNAWCADQEIYKDILFKAGFSFGANFAMPVNLIAVKINAERSLVISDCNLQMGIEEGY